jgi:hypothetical protein
MADPDQRTRLAAVEATGKRSTWLYVECAAANALVKIGDAAGIAKAKKRVPRCLAGF